MCALGLLRSVFTSAARSMATRTPIVGGNWKCNAGKGVTGADVDTLVTGLNALAAPSCEVYVAPPAIYLERVQASVSSDFNVSSQNIFILQLLKMFLENQKIAPRPPPPIDDKYASITNLSNRD